jgi:hypothetical protein
MGSTVNFCHCGGFYTVTTYSSIKPTILYCVSCLWGLECPKDTGWGIEGAGVEESFSALRNHLLGDGYYIEELNRLIL